MGFIRRQEERLAARLLQRQYEKRGIPAPAEGELMRQAAELVDAAHRIGRERGGNVAAILREMVAALVKKN